MTPSRQLLALLMLLLLGACISGEPPLESLLWQADLAAAPGTPEGVSGRGLLASNQNFTDMVVSIDGVDPEATFGWLVRTGTCGQDGARVGPDVAFPMFQSDALGHGERQAVLNRRLPAGTYALEVFRPGATPVPVACGNFVRIDASDL